MDRGQILGIVEELVRDTLDDESIQLKEDMLLEDIPNWDSVVHMTVMALLEQELGVQFEMEEITKVKSVGDIIELI